MEFDVFEEFEGQKYFLEILCNDNRIPQGGAISQLLLMMTCDGVWICQRIGVELVTNHCSVNVALAL